MLSHTQQADNRLYTIDQDIGERADHTSRTRKRATAIADPGRVLNCKTAAGNGNEPQQTAAQPPGDSWLTLQPILCLLDHLHQAQQLEGRGRGAGTLNLGHVLPQADAPARRSARRIVPTSSPESGGRAFPPFLAGSSQKSPRGRGGSNAEADLGRARSAWFHFRPVHRPLQALLLWLVVVPLHRGVQLFGRSDSNWFMTTGISFPFWLGYAACGENPLWPRCRASVSFTASVQPPRAPSTQSKRGMNRLMSSNGVPSNTSRSSRCNTPSSIRTQPDDAQANRIGPLWMARGEHATEPVARKGLTVNFTGPARCK